MINNWKSTITLGVSSFITVSYLPFCVAASFFSSQEGYFRCVAFGFLVASVLTALSGFLTKSPLVVIPALGTAFLLEPYVTGNIPMWILASACIIAGLVVAALNQFGVRKQLMEELPEEIKLGIRAGVGTLIGSTSIKFVIDCVKDSNSSKLPILLFAVAVLLLSIWDRMAPYLERRRFATKGLSYVFQQLHYVLIPVCVLISAIHFNLPMDLDLAPGKDLDYQAAPLNMQLMTSLAIALALSFILIADIPGHPCEILTASEIKINKNHAIEESLIETRVKGGFLTDALGSILSGGTMLLGTPVPPSLYVSENNLVRDFESWGNGKAPYVTAALFAITSAAIFLFGRNLSVFFPYIFIAISPVLFFISLKMIARSMIPEGKNAPKIDNPESLTKEEFSERMDFYLTPALMILLAFTHLGLAVSIPAGIILSVILRILRKDDTTTYKRPISSGLQFLFAASLVTVAVQCFTLFS